MEQKNIEKYKTQWKSVRTKFSVVNVI